MADRTIDYIALDQIVEWDDNPKDHDIGALTLSIQRFGFQAPLLLNDETGILLAGHGRLHALAQMQRAGEQTPDGIGNVNGQWLVPVVRGSQLSAQEAIAYSLADNRLVELGGWHEEDLAGLLMELAEDDVLEGTGWSPQDLDDLLRDLGIGISAKEETFDVDAALAADIEPRIKRGEAWQLGEHRLMCGDSGDAGDVAVVLAGEMPLLMVTDPPYGVAVDHSWRDGIANRIPSKRGGAIAGDNIADWGHVFMLWPAQVAYVWHGSMRMCESAQGLIAAGYDIRQQIIWHKKNMVLGRQAYHWRHEPCWYAVRKGKDANWKGDRSQMTVWEFGSPIMATPGQGADDMATLHPTQKPIGVFEIPIQNHTVPGDMICDPFIGSGTAIIGAERLGRRCLAMDIDPRWCEVAIQRWEDFTGQKAIKAHG